MTFSHPAWLAAGFLACLGLLWMWRRYDARQHAALARFVSAHLRAELTQSVSIGRRRTQRALMLTALALLFVALAGPLVGYRWEQISRRGNNIIFAIDTSRSMTTPDVKPDRLTRAKLAIDDFTNRLDGDGVGLVAFAGGAFLICPPTLDYGAFHESLNAIDTNIIARGGTNITSAIQEAQAALRRRPDSEKILILVTDGEDLEGDALDAAKEAARQDGLKIYTIGVGTPQGDLIPVPADQGGGFLKDESGAFVRSRLDEPALKAIAEATGGRYAPLGAEGQGFDTIYRAGLAPLLKHDLAYRQQKVYIERYQWPLAASLGLLLTSLAIGNRRRVGARRGAPARDARTLEPAALSAVMLSWLALSAASPVRASTTSAEDDYRKGDFLTAEHEYEAAAQRDPQKPALQFNAGAAAYRAGQFSQAAQAFQNSISRAPSGDAKRLADQEDAYYNLGNTLYRTGQQTEHSSPQQTMQTWTSAVKAYETALQLRPDDADSKFNRDFVKRKIKDLQQQQQNQQQPNQSQNQQQNQQGQSPQQNQQPNQQQGQSPQQNQSKNQPQNPQRSPPQQPPQNSPQQAKNDGSPQGQPPPPGADQPKPGSGQPKPGNGQPKPAPGGGTQPDQGAGDQDDTQHLPGQMSREEARELLDSQKADERHARGLPFALKEPDSPPDKPVRDW